MNRKEKIEELYNDVLQETWTLLFFGSFSPRMGDLTKKELFDFLKKMGNEIKNDWIK